jgi:hypothetical protein
LEAENGTVDELSDTTDESNFHKIYHFLTLPSLVVSIPVDEKGHFLFHLSKTGFQTTQLPVCSVNGRRKNDNVHHNLTGLRICSSWRNSYLCFHLTQYTDMFQKLSCQILHKKVINYN